MSIFSRPSTCPFSHPQSAGFALFGVLLLGLPLTACGLQGVEPEEIDIAAEESGGLSDTDTGGMNEAGTDGFESTADDSGGDGDGDTSNSGDGDGDGDTPCDSLSLAQVVDGANPIEVPDGPSLLQGSCGGVGPEAGYFYTATVNGTVQFTLSNATFEGALYLIDGLCEELDCEPAPQNIDFDMTTGQTVYILVDSFSVGGSGSLEITPI